MNAKTIIQIIDFAIVYFAKITRYTKDVALINLLSSLVFQSRVLADGSS